MRDDQSSGNQSLKTRNHNLHPVDVHPSNFADVTLVRDDRDAVENHEACTSCGRKTHSSHRPSRRKFCSAWNKFCRLCNKRGHFQRVCKVTIEEDIDEFEEIKKDDDELSFGEIAALRYCISQISKQVQRMNRVKVPHMLYDELKWIISQPPAQPYIRLQVAQFYRASKTDLYTIYSSDRTKYSYRDRISNLYTKICVEIGWKMYKYNSDL